jgi:opacity protein-like surface antigen
MQTKKILILILSVMSLCSHAQSFYVRAGLGAAICTAPRLQYSSTSVRITDSTSYTITESKRGGLGDGIPIVAAAGYYFSEHFGVELGVDYFTGFSHKTVDNFSFASETQKIHGSMLALVPGFVMKIDLDKINPYARIGLMIGILNNAITNKTFENTVSRAKDYGGIAVGAQIAIGAEYPLSDLLSIFGEVNMDGISWSPKKGKLTKYTESGRDLLADMPVHQKSWVYDKSLASSQTINEDEPEHKSAINYSFTNAGLIVGVKINLGK